MDLPPHLGFMILMNLPCFSFIFVADLTNYYMMRRFIAGLFIVVFCSLPEISNAQIYRKMEYIRKGNKKSIWNFAMASYLLVHGDLNYVWDHALKIYGEDSLMEEENNFEIIHTSDGLRLINVRSISYPNDTTLTVFGTFSLVNYNLNEEEKNKRLISRETSAGTAQLMKVNTDSEGRKYIKQWYQDEYIDIHDRDLTRVKVINHCKWLYTEKEKRQFFIRYWVAAGAARVGAGVAAVGGIIFVAKYGKWGT